jgi:L-asparaginase
MSANALKRLMLLSTGGTIASRYNAQTGRSEVAASGEDLVKAIPAIKTIADVQVETVIHVLSFRMTPEDVLTLVAAIRGHLAAPEVDGIVVTHGTDTMEETSFLVDLLVESPKPVVFTGAQLSGDMPGADGPRNLINALRVAAADAAYGYGTMVAFADGIYAARDAVKLHTSRLEAFGSKRGAPLGELTRDEIVFYAPPRPRVTYTTQTLITAVSLVRLVMGVDAQYLQFCLDRGAKALVLQAFGIGNATPEIVDIVRAAIDRGIPVVVTSRCAFGRVTPVYGSGGGQDLADAGALFAGDLSGEKARLALMVLLSVYSDRQAIGAELRKLVD